MYKPDSTGFLRQRNLPKSRKFSNRPGLCALVHVEHKGEYLICWEASTSARLSNLNCDGHSDAFADRSECELYDPVSKSWTTQQDVKLAQEVDDTPSVTRFASWPKPLIFTFFNACATNPESILHLQ